MFTGIITDLGRVRAAKAYPGESLRLEIGTTYDTARIETGASIACSGICLTVVDKGRDWLAFDVSNETLSKSTLGSWRKGDPVNLEKSLTMGQELGGHIVTGHADAVGEVRKVEADGNSLRLAISLPQAIHHLVAPKGSIAVDGVSLTVNEVTEGIFTVNAIPHTQKVTGLGALKPGVSVNLEADILARYIARMQDARGAS